jgi:hypothetical protein
LDRWKHNQKLDYEQLPFRWKNSQEDGHFSKDCKKSIANEDPTENEYQW